MKTRIVLTINHDLDVRPEQVMNEVTDAMRRLIDDVWAVESMEVRLDTEAMLVKLSKGTA